MTKVSVVIPCYNNEKTIAQTLQSVLTQTMQDIEIIVVDDGSTDGSNKIINSFGSRVKCISQENSGKSAIARNTGIRVATGEYLAFLDADDLWLPMKLEKQLAAMHRQNAQWCYCDCLIFRDTDKKNIGNYSQIYFPGKQGWIGKSQLMGNRICSPTPIIKRELLLHVGAFDESLSSREDWELWLRLAMEAPVVYLQEVLAKYRVHTGSKTFAMDPDFSFKNHQVIVEKITTMYPEELLLLKEKALAFYAARFSKSHWLLGNIPAAKSMISQAITWQPYNVQFYCLRFLFGMPAWLVNTGISIRNWLRGR